MAKTGLWDDLRDENKVLQLDKNTVYETPQGWQGGLNQSDTKRVMSHNQDVEERRMKKNMAYRKRKMKEKGKEKSMTTRMKELENELRENLVISLEGQSYITDSIASYAKNVAGLLKTIIEQKNILLDQGDDIGSSETKEAQKQLDSVRKNIDRMHVVK